MQVQNAECQIAQAQIGRFVSGGALSPEAMVQLEGHIGDCSACDNFLTERKAALQAILARGAKAAVLVEVPSEVIPAPADGLIARLREQLAGTPSTTEEREPQPDRRATLKPLLLSGALALVLVVMSLLSKNPTTLFGEKALPAAAALPASTPDAGNAKTEPTPPSVSPAATAAPVPPPEAAPSLSPSPTAPPPVVESVQAKPSTKPATPRPAATKPVQKPAPTPRKSVGSIRVYDAQGNQVSPNGS